MRLNVQIDRLILDGLPLSRAEARLVQSAAESELGRLLIEGGLSSELGAGASLPMAPAPPITVTAGAGPAALGHQIARSVYGGIGR